MTYEEHTEVLISEHNKVYMALVDRLADTFLWLDILEGFYPELWWELNQQRNLVADEIIDYERTKE